MAKAATKTRIPEDVVETFDIPQGTEEWAALRRGVPTASRFATIMANGKDGGDSVTRRKLMFQMAGEILTGETARTFRNEAMDRGIEMEPAARAYYERTRFLDLTPVGFVRRTIHNPLGDDLIVGCSPDSFVGADGLLQIKTMEPDLLIEVQEKGAAGFPTGFRAQCQGELWVTGRRWNDLMIFYDGMPFAPTFRIERSEEYIAQIKHACEIFAFELRQLVDRLQKAGGR